VEIFGTEFNVKWSRNFTMASRGSFDELQYSMTVTERTFMKITLPLLLFLKDLNTEFCKTQTNGLVVETRSQKHSWRTDVASTQGVFFSALKAPNV
jgi:hypothetical protein